MLRLENVHAYYGSSHVLQGISLEVKEGEIVSILGRNGMGKTTTFRTIMGLIRKASGKVLLNGENILGKPPHEISKKGIGYVPQGRQLFPTLTVIENLLLGTCNLKRASRKFIMSRLDFVFSIFPVLNHRRYQKAMTLSGGEQQMLAIARALMGNPSLILLDEPSESLAPIFVRKIYEVIKRLRDEEGLTVLLAEQQIPMALEVSDRCYIIEKGVIVLEGTPEDIKKDKRVIEMIGI